MNVPSYQFDERKAPSIFEQSEKGSPGNIWEPRFQKEAALKAHLSLYSRTIKRGQIRVDWAKEKATGDKAREGAREKITGVLVVMSRALGFSWNDLEFLKDSEQNNDITKFLTMQRKDDRGKWKQNIQQRPLQSFMDEMRELWARMMAVKVAKKK